MIAVYDKDKIYRLVSVLLLTTNNMSTKLDVTPIEIALAHIVASEYYIKLLESESKIDPEKIDQYRRAGNIWAIELYKDALNTWNDINGNDNLTPA